VVVGLERLQSEDAICLLCCVGGRTATSSVIARQGRIPSSTTIRDVENEDIARPSLRLALELVEGLGLGTIEELLGDVPSQRCLGELRAQLDEGGEEGSASA
jgi:hypothetical protein